MIFVLENGVQTYQIKQVLLQSTHALHVFLLLSKYKLSDILPLQIIKTHQHSTH